MNTKQSRNQYQLFGLWTPFPSEQSVPAGSWRTGICSSAGGDDGWQGMEERHCSRILGPSAPTGCLEVAGWSRKVSEQGCVVVSHSRKGSSQRWDGRATFSSSCRSPSLTSKRASSYPDLSFTCPWSRGVPSPGFWEKLQKGTGSLPLSLTILACQWEKIPDREEKEKNQQPPTLFKMWKKNQFLKLPWKQGSDKGFI